MKEIHLMGKFLIIGGVILFVTGLLLLYWDKIPFLGKLPGDIVYKGKNFTFYFPIVTSILISLIISLIIYLFRK